METVMWSLLLLLVGAVILLFVAVVKLSWEVQALRVRHIPVDTGSAVARLTAEVRELQNFCRVNDQAVTQLSLNGLEWQSRLEAVEAQRDIRVQEIVDTVISARVDMRAVTQQNAAQALDALRADPQLLPVDSGDREQFGLVALQEQTVFTNPEIGESYATDRIGAAVLSAARSVPSHRMCDVPARNAPEVLFGTFQHLHILLELLHIYTTGGTTQEWREQLRRACAMLPQYLGATPVNSSADEIALYQLCQHCIRLLESWHSETNRPREYLSEWRALLGAFCAKLAPFAPISYGRIRTGLVSLYSLGDSRAAAQYRSGTASGVLAHHLQAAEIALCTALQALQTQDHTGFLVAHDAGSAAAELQSIRYSLNRTWADRPPLDYMQQLVIMLHILNEWRTITDEYKADARRDTPPASSQYVRKFLRIQDLLAQLPHVSPTRYVTTPEQAVESLRTAIMSVIRMEVCLRPVRASVQLRRMELLVLVTASRLWPEELPPIEVFAWFSGSAAVRQDSPRAFGALHICQYLDELYESQELYQDLIATWRIIDPDTTPEQAETVAHELMRDTFQLWRIFDPYREAPHALNFGTAEEEFRAGYLAAWCLLVEDVATTADHAAMVTNFLRVPPWSRDYVAAGDDVMLPGNTFGHTPEWFSCILRRALCFTSNIASAADPGLRASEELPSLPATVAPRPDRYQGYQGYYQGYQGYSHGNQGFSQGYQGGTRRAIPALPRSGPITGSTDSDAVRPAADTPYTESPRTWISSGHRRRLVLGVVTESGEDTVQEEDTHD